jgi:hypothetical protein
MAERIGGFDPNEVVEAAVAVKDRIADVAQQAAERLELERRMRDDPWIVLGVAAGAGFVLGGGLWPALRPVVKAVGRTLFTPSNLLAVAAALGAMRAAQSQAGDETAGPAAGPTEH